MAVAELSGGGGAPQVKQVHSLSSPQSLQSPGGWLVACNVAYGWWLMVGGWLVACVVCIFMFSIFFSPKRSGRYDCFFLGKDRRQGIPLTIGSVDSLQISIGDILHSTCTVVIGKIWMCCSILFCYISYYSTFLYKQMVNHSFCHLSMFWSTWWSPVMAHKCPSPFTLLKRWHYAAFSDLLTHHTNH